MSVLAEEKGIKALRGAFSRVDRLPLPTASTRMSSDEYDDYTYPDIQYGDEYLDNTDQ